MRFFVTIFGAVLAITAAALPTGELPTANVNQAADHVGDLVWGDITAVLNPACQMVPQNDDVPGLTIPTYWTMLHAEKKWSCQLYRERNCTGTPFWDVKNGEAKSEYLPYNEFPVWSAKCVKTNVKPN